eukprot:TRINITY_DN5706_c0_g1_i1.p1 TRINITY_DN5706_c0_g1~~TRINITY_DN5706_c0_g1_i1.p1  ORF type:complete len:758 (+),score=216.76 TRINITY_DN5706_c0_g1_i1:105-2378(+)
MMRPTLPIALLLATCAGGAGAAKFFTPNYQACTSALSKALRFCNSSLSPEDRVDDLVSRLTLHEKVMMICPQPDLGKTCYDHTAGVARLGVPQWMWLVETNTGVKSACIGKHRCATTFSGPMGIGAAFNRTLWRAKGAVLGTELRAFSNAHWHRSGSAPHPALELMPVTGFGPNINIARDPRFGRSSELPGEDPYLSGHYASEMVQGLQEKDARGHLKTVAFLKHFTAYSTESKRGHDSYSISMHDFWDTYLPQYEIAMTEGGASGVMCSYDAENGRPSCANDWLLNKVLRGWNKDAVVTTDCTAVSDLRGPPVHAPSDEHAAAFALNNGTDIEMGSTVFTKHLESAVQKGLATEAAVTAAVRRAQLSLFRAGRFDPPEEIEWSTISSDVINSTAHRAVQLDAAHQAMVLLKNDGVLPLRAGASVAVVGPQGVTRSGLLSDYYGDDVCMTESCSGRSCFDCIPTIAEGVAAANVGGSTSSAAGVDVASADKSGIADALALVQKADAVVLALGNDRTQEKEGHDRNDTALPGLQEYFARQVLALGKPTVLVLVNGGAIAIDNLVASPSAIVEAFNPNTVGSIALGQTLFGQSNRWGKLPVTMYPHDYIQQQPMTNYDMAKPPGRTYRYYTGTPLYPFGFGLSYTSFSLACKAGAGSKYAHDCTVSNTGSVAGDEVVMVFHAAGSAIRKRAKHPVPLKALVDFGRISLAAGASGTLSFALDEKALRLVNENGDRVLYKGQHELIFSRGHGDEVRVAVTV